MKELIIDGFIQDGVEYYKVYAFVHNGKAFLLGESGTYLLLEEELFEAYCRKEITEAFAMKLIQRGLAWVPGSAKIQLPDVGILPSFFMISLTNTCNMRCKYCFNHFEPETASVISDEMIEKIIDYIVNYCRTNNAERIAIQAWGGEPLICMKQLTYMYELLEKSGIHYSLCIETNASLITEEIAAQLKRMNIQIGVSIDGYEEIQNVQRPLVGDVPSYEKVSRGIKALNKHYEKGTGSITVVTKLVLSRLEEILDYFAKGQMVRSVKLNVARLPEGNPMALSMEEIDDFAKRLVDKMCELTEQGYTLTEGNIVERLKNLLYRSNINICHSHGCQGGKRMISFDMHGNIYPCEMTDYPEECLGSIFSDKDLISLIREKEGKGYFAPKDLGNCEHCAFKYFCGGGCTTAIIYKKGKVEGIDETGCRMNKAIYPRLIQLILEKPDVAEKMLR